MPLISSSAVMLLQIFTFQPWGRRNEDFHFTISPRVLLFVRVTCVGKSPVRHLLFPRQTSKFALTHFIHFTHITFLPFSEFVARRSLTPPNTNFHRRSSGVRVVLLGTQKASEKTGFVLKHGKSSLIIQYQYSGYGSKFGFSFVFVARRRSSDTAGWRFALR